MLLNQLKGLTQKLFTFERPFLYRLRGYNMYSHLVSNE
jgi:hypothetical protein